MGFMFFSKWQARYNSTADGRTSSTNRSLSQVINTVRDCFGFYILEQSSPAPANQTLKTSTDVYNPGDSRALFQPSTGTPGGASTPVRARFITGSSRAYIWADTASWPAEKAFEVIVNNPESVISIGWTFGGSGSGNNIKGIFRLPIFPNLRTFYAVNGTGSTAPGSTAISQIVGYWPETLKHFHFTNELGTGAAFLSDFPKLPAAVETIIFGQNNAAMSSATLMTKINSCTGLTALLFTEEVWGDNSVGVYIPMVGSVDISFITTKLEYFSLGISSGLTNLVYTAGLFSEIKRLNFHRNTSVANATMLAILNEFLSSPNGEFLQISLSNRTFSKNFVDSDLKAGVIGFYIYGNMITGTISFTSPKALPSFKIGTQSVLSAASKNNFSSVNISGLTQATILDLSNSQIVNLTLPVNTVCDSLYLGGNKLDHTVNPSLISQIRAMTGLTSLNLSIGTYATAASLNGGQDSTNGMGAMDISTLTNLSTLVAAQVGLSGLLKLPASLLTLAIPSNPNLSGIDTGSVVNLIRFIASNCTLFNFDFTRTTKIRFITVSGSGVTAIDINNRTETATLGSAASDGAAITAVGCPNLVSVVFPANAVNAVIAVGNAASMVNIQNCPLLTSMSNMDKISYSALNTTSRAFIASGCALNIDFKFGINNFLPNNIQIHNNGMNQANVDQNIHNIYLNRGKWSTTTVLKSIQINGTNAAPSGIEQAPSGFVLGVSDGTPTTAKEEIYVLEKNYGWQIDNN